MSDLRENYARMGYNVLPGMVLVHLPNRYPDSITIAGHRLYFDPTYEMEKHKLIRGHIAALGDVTAADYHAFSTVNGEKRVNEVQDVLGLADEVFLDYMDIDDSTEVFPEYYVVQYTSLLAKVDNGRLVPLGSKILLRPIWPAGVGLVRLDTANVPVRFNPDGTMMAVPDNLNDWEKPVLRPIETEAYVAFVGAPLRSRPDRFVAGQKVTFRKGYGWLVTMLDKDYLVMPQDAITGIYRTPETDPELFGTLTVTVGGEVRSSTQHYVGRPAVAVDDIL